MAEKTTPESLTVAVAHEKTDVDAGALTRLGIVLGLALLMAAAASFGIFRLLARYEAKDDPPPPPLVHRDPNRLPAEPRLQTHPPSELALVRQQEREVLETAGWVDKKAGTVRIPIEDAIRLYAARAAAALAAHPSPAGAAPSPGPSPSASSAPSPSPGGHP